TRVHHTDRFGNVLSDPVTGEDITEVEWGAADALPFALCISAVTDQEHGARLVQPVSVARGNVVAADHGRWPGADASEAVGAVPEPPPAPVSPTGADCGAIASAVPPPLPVFFPALKDTALTFARPYDPAAPASSLGHAPALPATPAAPQIEVRDDHDE